MHILRTLVPGLALLVTACSGGGGGGDQGSGQPGGSPTLLGERELPGYQLAVSREAGLITVHVAPTEGTPAPAQVEAVVGQAASWDLALAGQDLGGGRYAWTVPPGSAGRVWVRVTDHEGDTLESGGEDFALE